MEAFFILPDAEAGDACDLLHISIAGRTETITAIRMAKLIDAVNQFVEDWEDGDEFDNRKLRVFVRKFREVE